MPKRVGISQSKGDPQEPLIYDPGLNPTLSSSVSLPIFGGIGGFVVVAVAVVENMVVVGKKELMAIDQVRALVDREEAYSYRKFLGKYPSSTVSASAIENEPRFHLVWREKICEWTYNVTDQ